MHERSPPPIPPPVLCSDVGAIHRGAAADLLEIIVRMRAQWQPFRISGGHHSILRRTPPHIYAIIADAFPKMKAA